MQQISSLLERLEKITRPDIAVREAVSKAINKEMGVDIPEKDISVRGGVVLIKTHNSVFKNEIFLKKKNLLAYLEEVFPGKIKDIK